MKTWVGITIGVVALGVVATMVYLGFKKPTKGDMPEDEANDSLTPTTPTTLQTASNVGSVSNENFPLKRGMRGNNVTRLQVGLNDYIKSKRIVAKSFTPTGFFGSKTENALMLLTGSKSVDEVTFNKIVSGSYGFVAPPPSNLQSSSFAPEPNII